MPTSFRFVEPMAARPTAELPVGDEWIYEVKWDGYRMLIVKDVGTVRLISRNNKDHTARFPSIAAAATRIKQDRVVIDGELVAISPDGRPSFQGLQNSTTEKPLLVYYAFDLLQEGDDTLRSHPLEERRARLRKIIAKTSLRYSSELPGTAERVVEEVRKLGLEGVIAKRRDSPYVPGERSHSWLKLKLSPEQEFVVGGFRPGRSGVESILVGHHAEGGLQFVAQVRAGLSASNRRPIQDALRTITTAACPFKNLPMKTRGRWREGVSRENMRGITWVEPLLVVQIAYVEWTREQLLRHPTFKGVRSDKKATDVVREGPP